MWTHKNYSVWRIDCSEVMFLRLETVPGASLPTLGCHWWVCTEAQNYNVLSPCHFPFYVLPPLLTSSESFVLPSFQSLAPTQSWSFHHQFLISRSFSSSTFISPTGPCSLLWDNKLISAKVLPPSRDHISTLVDSISWLRREDRNPVRRLA